jgi:rhomboid family protein
MKSAWMERPEPGGASGLAFPSPTPITKRLLWINGLIFLAFLVLLHVPVTAEWGRSLYQALALSPPLWKEWTIVPLWQPLTYGFLHSESDPLHLLYNLLGLYFFGTLLEGIIGPRRFLWVYLAAILLGGLVQLGVAFLGGAPEAQASTVGASGGILCIIVAAAVMQPNARVIFILVPLTLKVLAMILVGLDLFYLITGGSGGTAHWVHLTGATWGFAAAKLRWVWIDPWLSWSRARATSQRRAQERESERLDRLLAQIHDRGIQSLSRRDREFLKRASSRK